MTDPIINLEPSDDTWVTNGNHQRLIPDPDTGKLRPYRRVSSFAKTLDDCGALPNWQAWMTLRGAQTEGAAQHVIAALKATKTPRESIEQLARLGGSKDKATKGQDRHKVIAMALAGYSLDALPDQARAEVTRITDLIRSLGEIRATEQALIVDRYQLAGTCDYLLTDPDGRTVVADFKTGDSLRLTSTAVQLGAYVQGVTWERTQTRGEPITTDLANARLVVVWAPQDGRDPRLVELDTAQALAAVELADTVRKIRADYGKQERAAAK